MSNIFTISNIEIKPSIIYDLSIVVARMGDRMEESKK